MSNEKQFSQGFTPNLPLWSFQLQKDSKLALKTRKDLEIHLITRALKDESFRAELIANPKSVIEQEIGSKLPDELEITVLEETEDTIYMVLPCNPYEGVSEEELQANLGMSYEDVALWVLEQQRNSILDEEYTTAILSKCWKDEHFKDAWLNNSTEILKKEFELEIPVEIKIKAIEETTKKTYVVLPNLLANNFNYLVEMPNIIDIAGSSLGSSQPQPQTTVPCVIVTITLFLCPTSTHPLY
jgi:hypothetical protein